MNKKILFISIILLGIFCFLLFYNFDEKETNDTEPQALTSLKIEKEEKKSIEEKQRTVEQRAASDFDMQKDPVTGLVPRE
ncbi:MAG: hypothetical protein ACI9Y7_000921 [Dokdonia sp.]|jgi:hypothetical protein